MLDRIADFCSNKFQVRIQKPAIEDASSRLSGPTPSPSTTQLPSDPPAKAPPPTAPTSSKKGNGEGQTEAPPISLDVGGEPTSIGKAPPPKTSTSDPGSRPPSPPPSQTPSTPPPAPSPPRTTAPTNQQPPVPTATSSSQPSTGTSISSGGGGSESPITTSPPPVPATTDTISSIEETSPTPSPSPSTSSSRAPERFNGGTPFDPPVMGAGSPRAAAPFPYLPSSSPPRPGALVFLFSSAVALGMTVLL